MRPVTRVAKPGSYPYDFRVDSQANLEADEKAVQLPFPKSKNIETAFGTRSPTAWQVLDGLLKLAKFTGKKRSATIKNLQAAKATIERRIGTEYKKAGPGLAASYGKFCNYCDQYLPSQVDVEHCIPKDPYPLFCMSWDNFLLACNVCNSTKSNNPDRAESSAWVPGGANEVARYDAIRQRYQWPDVGGMSYRDLRPAVYFRDGGGWQRAGDASSVDRALAITREDLPTRRVWVRKPGHDENEVQVRLEPQTAEAQRMIELCGLQKDGTESSGISDTRMYNRTRTWFKVLGFVSPLIDDLDGNFATVWPLLVQSAPIYGFFSVWVRILDLTGASDAKDPRDPSRTVMDAFLAEANFPNTDTSHVP